MIVKNAIKEDKNYFEESVDIQKNGEKRDFIQEMLCEFKSNGTKEYGEKISIEKLNSLVPKEVMEKYDELTMQVIAMKIKYTDVSMIVSRAMVLSALVTLCLLCYFFLEKGFVEEKELFGIANMWMGILMIVAFLSQRKISKIKKDFKVDIKDEDGRGVKAIWFLYHNMSFKSDEQKNEFIKNNYGQFNYFLNIDSEKCLEREVKPSDYLENFKDRVLTCLEEGSED